MMENELGRFLYWDMSSEIKIPDDMPKSIISFDQLINEVYNFEDCIIIRSYFNKDYSINVSNLN